MDKLINWYQKFSKYGLAKLPDFDKENLPLINAKFEKDQLEILLDFDSNINNNFQFLVRDRTFINSENLISGSDFGFVELRNPNELPKKSNYFVDLFVIESYLKSLGINVLPDYISLYIYENINLPRRLHHDTSFDSFKIFIAVTDISDITYGPYVYVKGSHRNILYKISDFISLLGIRRTGGDAFDSAWINWKNISYPYIDRGQVIISNQKGIHGDLPSSKGKSKILLALCFNKKNIKEIFNYFLN